MKQDVVVSDSARIGDDTAKATLSQLFARILGQLSVTAWLPAAALVLTLLFAYVFAGQLNNNSSGALAAALEQLSSIQLGGMALVVVAIAATTMLTQAFAFAAIRWLEGYWGSGWLATALAHFGGWRQARVRRRLTIRYDKLLARAWSEVLAGMSRNPVENHRRALRTTTDEDGVEPPKLTKAMIAKLQERIIGVKSNKRISESQAEIVANLDWEAYVGRPTLHRLRSIERRVQDYPHLANHVMPTRLGNILRRSEDLTGQYDVEEFVERVFSKLPFDLQLAHDEERSRLDLYCSMVFILWFAVIPTSVAFFPRWEAWPICLTAGALGSWICYSAALATARHYGAILVSISETVGDD